MHNVRVKRLNLIFAIEGWCPSLRFESSHLYNLDLAMTSWWPWMTWTKIQPDLAYQAVRTCMVRLLNGFYKFQTSGLGIKGVQGPTALYESGRKQDSSWREVRWVLWCKQGNITTHCPFCTHGTHTSLLCGLYRWGSSDLGPCDLAIFLIILSKGDIVLISEILQ